jgi:hypothetical protein
MPSPDSHPTLSLETQRQQFASRRLLAMPAAGLLAWLVIGLAGLWLPAHTAVWVLFGGTGSIVYLGMLFSRFTGENFLDRRRPKNVFDSLFLLGTGQALLVWALAIPFAQADYTSLPLTVGILTGLMWLPLSWILQHWVGLAHGVARTGLLLAAWYAFPGQRFVVIPLLIVFLYALTIAVLEHRWRRVRAAGPTPD